MKKLLRKGKKLDPNQILIAEFKYAEQSAFQANQDRLALYNYFFSTGGALIAALVLGNNFESTVNKTIFIIVFLGLFIWGIVSYLKLLKIRDAWNSSILAMNQIKAYYTDKTKHYKLEEAFRWTGATKPQKGKIWSITFLMGILFAIVDSFSLGMAVYLIAGENLLIAVPVGLIVLASHYVIWIALLKD